MTAKQRQRRWNAHMMKAKRQSKDTPWWRFMSWRYRDVYARCAREDAEEKLAITRDAVDTLKWGYLAVLCQAQGIDPLPRPRKRASKHEEIGRAYLAGLTFGGQTVRF